MKVIVNKGQKIINIGNVALLPDCKLDDEKAVETALANPVIKSLVKKGVLVVKEKTEKKAEAAKTTDESGESAGTGEDTPDNAKAKAKK